jgi:hypothetical protein
MPNIHDVLVAEGAGIPTGCTQPDTPADSRIAASGCTRCAGRDKLNARRQSLTGHSGRRHCLDGIETVIGNMVKALQHGVLSAGAGVLDGTIAQL